MGGEEGGEGEGRGSGRRRGRGGDGRGGEGRAIQKLYTRILIDLTILIRP